jgi:hypothetical protein
MPPVPLVPALPVSLVVPAAPVVPALPAGEPPLPVVPAALDPPVPGVAPPPEPVEQADPRKQKHSVVTAARSEVRWVINLLVVMAIRGIVSGGR